MNPQALIHGNGDLKQTLVVVFLRGGADGLSLVAPVVDDDYHRFRPRLGVKAAVGVRLDDNFALHPLLAPLRGAWDEGQLAIIHAAGSEDRTRSHFEAQDFMEHGGLVAGGWLGRYLRHRERPAGSALTAVAVGSTMPECLLGAPTATVMETPDEFTLGSDAPALRAGLENLYAAEPGRLAGAARDTFDALRRLDAMRTEKVLPANGAIYDEKDGFQRGLRDLARLIKADLGVEASSVDLGGWDSHFTQTTMIESLMRRLAAGLDAFRRDLGGRMATTTVVVMTEFGRSLVENSAFGTDHGRGSVMFVLGGGVRGGRMHGAWQGLGKAALEQRGESEGDLPVLNNYRDILAPILTRHGATAAALEKVFPGHALTPLALYA